MTTDLGHTIAGKLLDIEAIKLNLEHPFTWSSGWKSPIYCDNRLSLSFPEIRTYIKNALVEAIKANYPDVEAIAGVATAGIPQGALVAEAMGLPFLYVRSKPKGHGMENMIEGKVTPGQKVVVIEDLVSTGGSSLKAAEALKANNIEVLGMAAIFTYGFDLADKNFANAGIPLVCLSNYNLLLEEALERDYIKQEQLGSLEAWRRDPANWQG
ncbi:Orotate phosphoribosyltransferase [Fulvivirga imtechensis AK7]|uniref:Orotate phosphoribosyltransferase n=1 Tax=Fulvivirga imtechensis AK7 TaxID=1237149 RepID=L8JUB6_9BACT|nr:orotate phosphoribosyltransferase [Fulvivirga imtechensis]ELR71833.1 Orotate phosphoribosyltransferase [Fulvivirga imtechensis AK7]